MRFTAFESIVKLLIKFKNCSKYDAISNAYTFLIFLNVKFYFCYHIAEWSILPNLPISSNFFGKKTFGDIGPFPVMQFCISNGSFLSTSIGETVFNYNNVFYRLWKHGLNLWNNMKQKFPIFSQKSMAQMKYQNNWIIGNYFILCAVKHLLTMAVTIGVLLIILSSENKLNKLIFIKNILQTFPTICAWYTCIQVCLPILTIYYLEIIIIKIWICKKIFSWFVFQLLSWVKPQWFEIKP